MCSIGHAGRGQRRADLDAFDVAPAEEHERHARRSRRRACTRGSGCPRAARPAPPARARECTPARASAPSRSASCRRRGTRRRARRRRRARSSSGAPCRCRSRSLPFPLPLPFACASSLGSAVASGGGAGSSKWNGTVVTLACGSRAISRAIDSAVWSCRMRCHAPLNMRSGSSTHTSASPLLSSWATVTTADRVSRRSGQSMSSSPRLARPCSRQSLGEPVGVVLVDHEVHRAQLVGAQRAAELHRAGDGEVEPVDEHHHDEPAPHRRGDGLRHLVHERVVFAFVLLGQAHEEHDHDRHEDDDHPRAVRELGDRDHDGDRPRS